ncbi:MAG: hypothetical protein EOL88_03080 [Bacteroidia bacterium]|nr:hypothetical protein [Bacteroidales bacterium]MDD2322307.1 hypothetical protein [Bacteroidales bacterium]MDD3961247.1 hypothetical protein [Bacteroidales bacterium]MDY0285620.1 hypothetical protein [Bacteroidales bacterium]NCD41052.1 hypothetical protein [Bacteroidia bacterium]
MWGRIVLGLAVLCILKISDVDYTVYPVTWCYFHLLPGWRLQSTVSALNSVPRAPVKSAFFWNLTAGGNYHSHWAQVPETDSRMNTTGEVSYYYCKEKNNFTLQGNFCYELGMNAYGIRKIEKSSDCFEFSAKSAMKGRPFFIHISTQGMTQLLPVYAVLDRDTSGLAVKQLTSSVLSPATLMFAYGYTYKLQQPVKGELEIGLAGGKMSFMVNQRLFASQKAAVLNDVQAGEWYKTEYGVNLKIEFEKLFSSNIQWSNRSTLFIEDDDLRSPGCLMAADVEIRNAVIIRSGKRIKTRIETVFRYDKDYEAPFQMRHSVTLGFGE